MSIRRLHAATQGLTRGHLVLHTRRWPSGWLAFAVLLVAGGLAAIAAAQLHQSRQEAGVQQHVAVQGQLQELQRELEQARLLQRVSAARSEELERQIDALNRALRESQEELGFLRQARAGNR